MDPSTMHRQIFERSCQRRQLDAFFATRDKREYLLHSMPRLNLGEVDPRAKARGVYVLSLFDTRLACGKEPWTGACGDDSV